MSTTSTLKSRRSSLVSQHHAASKVKLAKGTAAQNARGRRGSQSVSIRNAAAAAAAAAGNAHQEDEHQTAASKSTETIHFVYSLAVVRALRSVYRLTALGPPSAPRGKPEPAVEIARLPTLYADFQLVTRLVDSNQRYAERLRRELEASGDSRPGSSKLPSLASRKSSIKSNWSRRSRNVGQNADDSSVTRLPPIT